MPGTMRSTELAKLATGRLPHLKVLFTSGYAQNAIVHGGRLDPGVHLLSKPYSREQLASKIRRMLGASKSDTTVPVASPSADSMTSQPSCAPASIAILVVDDDIGSRESVSELLTTMGYDVFQAADAEEGLHVLMTGKVDVLLTDIVLPGQSGIEFAETAVERNPDIRVVFVSGAERPTPEDVGFECASLSKPFTSDQLHAVIKVMHGPHRRTKG